MQENTALDSLGYVTSQNYIQVNFFLTLVDSQIIFFS